MSSLASDYHQLTAGAGAVGLDRDVVRVSGEEAVSYLQGQLSQDVAGLAVGATAWSLVLQPQGKVDAWVRVTRVGASELWLDVDGGFGPAVVERLQRFKLRVRAELELLAWSCMAVRGPSAGGAPTGAVPFEWNGWTGYDLLGPSPSAPPDVPAVDEGAYEVRRIEVGLPRMGAELTAQTIPAEAGVVEASVSFTKGCYTGQELVARIDSRGGNVPRRLRGVVLSEPVPVGTAIELDGRPVGTLTSVAAHPEGHAVGLAYVGRDVSPPAEGSCGGVAASVRLLPLVV